MFNLKSKWVRLSAGFAAGAVLLWASGIAPQAYNLIEGNGTPAPRASTLNFANTASVTWSCTTAAGVTACQATASGGGGGSGGGIVTYSSGAAINPVGTQYVAIGGGGQASATEADVEIGSPSAATISALFVNLDLPPGIGNSIAFTWRKAGSDQTLTCTVSGAVATTCSDTTHSFTVAQGDLIDIKLVTTGSVIVAPGLTIATAYGTSGTAGYLTVQNNGTPLPQEPVLNLINGTNSTYVCADNPGNTSTDCQVNASGGGTQVGPPLTSPNLITFTALNLSPAVITTAVGSITVDNTANSDPIYNVHGELVALSATPWSVVAAFQYLTNNSTGSGLMGGLLLQNAASGNVAIMGPQYGDGGGILYLTNPTSLSAAVGINLGQTRNNLFWFKITDDGTTRNFWYGDGLRWINLRNETHTTNLTPDHTGFGVTGGPAMVACYSFAIYNSII